MSTKEKFLASTVIILAIVIIVFVIIGNSSARSRCVTYHSPTFGTIRDCDGEKTILNIDHSEM